MADRRDVEEFLDAVAPTASDPAPTQRKGRFFATFTGRRFWPLDPRPEDVDLRDIARSLSRTARFHGHIRFEHYSVAQHAVLAALHVGRDMRPDPLWDRIRYCALHHDDAEAYPPGDIVAPVKHDDNTHPAIEWLKQVQDRIEAVVRARLDLPWRDPPQVKAIDIDLLATEKRDVCGGWHPDDTPVGRALDKPISRGWSPLEAELAFLQVHFELAARISRDGLLMGPLPISPTYDLSVGVPL
jgi:uncharacterized protein